RRPGAAPRRRQVHVRSALREVAGEVGLHRGRQGRAVGQVPGEVRDQGAVRRAAGRPRRLLGLHHQRGGLQKDGDLKKAAVGTGPFMLDDWKVEQQMTLKKHAGYLKKGLPYVDEVVLRIIPDEANIVAALRTGQIHHAFIEDNKNYNLLKEEKSLTGYRSSRLGYDYLNINATRGPLKDVRVRQAISWAVDRAQ